MPTGGGLCVRVFSVLDEVQMADIDTLDDLDGTHAVRAREKAANRNVGWWQIGVVPAGIPGVPPGCELSREVRECQKSEAASFGNVSSLPARRTSRVSRSGSSCPFDFL
ncbi:hypothetical protein TREMEDRAFT_62535 [Tremella mesenterica DSM 1558]|uniref:uncharacterized protein n=1 Tax=Tremella mesenterica (strain ATCC 24925 / CBS 8224 / DSM 1558 / NBRC 9311 / NRRL Y-6157 / RJB 2259-6 / UBC 559-6) TaxID=578456 RepID=UPI0003F4A4B7|nr:uncharacterized protein TREMEDRAFT_62535 [Tremella mesenterica DSM 1558]EIW69666.1 hypothetical protein TREMEDRAFT_62535 [Tremella mesenterica DSM 1558]